MAHDLEVAEYFNDWVKILNQWEKEDKYPHQNSKNQVDWLAMKIYHGLIAKKHIWMTGIGKSGLVGEYFCQMLQSIGVCCHVLEPTNALHGDIGAVDNNDIVIFFSKGGRNPEFVNISKALQARGIETLAVCCNSSSGLVDSVTLDNSVILPQPVEDSGWNVMPTTSILCFNYFSILVFNRIKEWKAITRDEYYQYHPRGAIGELLQHRVRDIMKPLPTDNRLHLTSTLREALVYLTTHRLACCILVDKDQRLQGIFSDRDIRDYLLVHNNPLDEPLHKLSHQAKVTTTPDTLLVNLGKQLESVDLKYLSGIPVIEEDRVVGIINHKILLKHCQHLLK